MLLFRVAISIIEKRGPAHGVSIAREVAAFVAETGEIDVFDGRTLCWMSYEVRGDDDAPLLIFLGLFLFLHVIQLRASLFTSMLPHYCSRKMSHRTPWKMPHRAPCNIPRGPLTSYRTPFIIPQGTPRKIPHGTPWEYTTRNPL